MLYLVSVLREFIDTESSCYSFFFKTVFTTKLNEKKDMQNNHYDKLRNNEPIHI